MIKKDGIHYLVCHSCGKCVSSGFVPIAVEGFEGLVVRAYIECPECIERLEIRKKKNETDATDNSLT